MKKFKEKIKDYFSIKNSIEHLMDASTGFFLIPMDLDGIINGIRNKIKFRMSIVHLIYVLLSTTLNVFSFATSNYLYSLLKFNLMPDHMKPFLMFTAFASSWLVPIKMDFILGQIKSKLSSFKIFYYLINNLQLKHKLTDANLNRLSILSRIIQIILLDVGMTIIIILNVAIMSLIAILSRNWIWIFQSIIYIPAAIIWGFNTCLWMCIVFIIFIYYKFRFDQINQQIKTIISNEKVINKMREKHLIKLINEHNSISIEIYQINLLIRRTAAATFFMFSIIKVDMIYFLINFDNVLVKMLMFLILITLALFSFALSYLFTQQIKSAHRSYKLIHFVICNYKMRLTFKFKV